MSEKGSSQLLEKNSYRIGEVAALTRIEPHVLRYWETEFPALRPHKSPHGQRLYRRSDIETIRTIKRLLYEQGFTIAGARRQLQEGNGRRSKGATPTPATAVPNGSAARQQLLVIRAELARLLTLLSRR